MLPELIPPTELPCPQMVPVPEHPLPAFCANPVVGELASPMLESTRARAIDLIMVVFV